MRSKIVKDFSLLTLILIISGLAVFVFIKLVVPDISEEKSENSVSMEIEKSLGKLIRQQILIDSNVSNSIVTKKAVSDMVDYLLRDKDLFNDEITVIIIESNVVNAMALPGGTIVIYTGLIKAAENPEEVMAVLAHEIGHLYNRDSYNSVIRSIGLSVVISAMTGGDSEIIGRIINNLLTTSYSRDIEERADDFAIDLLLFQKINPIYLAEFFQRLQDIYTTEDSEESLLKYFSTHPSTDTRIEKAQLAALSFTGTGEKIDIDWDKIQKEQSSFF